MINGLNAVAMIALGMKEDDAKKALNCDTLSQAVEIMTECGLSDVKILAVLPEGSPTLEELRLEAFKARGLQISAEEKRRLEENGKKEAASILKLLGIKSKEVELIGKSLEQEEAQTAVIQTLMTEAGVKTAEDFYRSMGMLAEENQAAEADHVHSKTYFFDPMFNPDDPTIRFIDADLQMHKVERIKGYGSLQVGNSNVDVCLAKLPNGDGALLLTVADTGRTLGYLNVVDGKLCENYVYISPERDFITRMYDKGTFVKDVCNHTVEQLLRVNFDINEPKDKDGDVRFIDGLFPPHKDPLGVDMINYYALTNVQMVQLTNLAHGIDPDSPKPYTVPHHESGKVYTPIARFLQDTEVEPLTLDDRYKVGAARFNRNVHAAFSGIKELVEALDGLSGDIGKRYDILLKNGFVHECTDVYPPDKFVTKDDFMHTATWLMDIIGKGLNPEKWFDEKFPNGAPSEEAVSEAVRAATT